MRYAKKVVATTNAQSLVALLPVEKPDIRGCVEVILQAPAGNTADLNFGNHAAQPGYIVPGGNAVLEVDNLQNVWVSGNGSDEVIILVTR